MLFAKKSFLFFLISLVSFSFGYDSLKLFTKIVSKNTFVEINNLNVNDDTNEKEDVDENDGDTFLEYYFNVDNTICVFELYKFYSNHSFLHPYNSTELTVSIDFPPELI